MAGLMQWDPFAGLTNLHSQLDDMFGHFLSNVPSARGSAAMDVYNDGTSLVVEVQAPGFAKDDITVHVNNGVLEIKGEKDETDEQTTEPRNYVVRESHASFYRRVALPKGADGDEVGAHFENGLLKITVPLKELPAPKKVSIQSGAGKSANVGSTKKPAPKSAAKKK